VVAEAGEAETAARVAAIPDDDAIARMLARFEHLHHKKS
jgi:hypothetical protein